MTDPTYFILYVKDPLSSATFYNKLLGKDPIETSPTYVMYALDSGVKLGLWATHDVDPQTTFSGAGCEVAFFLKDKDELEKVLHQSKEAGIPVIQGITTLDFGKTFTVLDPDNHRLRFFTPHAA